jgi:hypothetical protein
MGSENGHGYAQKGKNGLGFDFFRAIPQIWRLIYHIVRVTGDETWFSFVNSKIKKQ